MNAGPNPSLQLTFNKRQVGSCVTLHSASAAGKTSGPSRVKKSVRSVSSGTIVCWSLPRAVKRSRAHGYSTLRWRAMNAEPRGREVQGQAMALSRIPQRAAPDPERRREMGSGMTIDLSMRPILLCAIWRSRSESSRTANVFPSWREAL